jgi:hypothetical protein
VTVTLSPSPGPTLDQKTDVAARIIKLPSRAEIAEALGPNPSEKEIMDAAAILACDAAKRDIIVFDHRPWHKPGNELRPHPKVHHEDGGTILRVSFRAHERAVWWSQQPFQIVAIHHSPDHPAVAGSPYNPFDGPPPPYDSRPEPDLANHGTVHVVRARPIVQEAVGQMYKIAFYMDELIDPDMEAMP